MTALFVGDLHYCPRNLGFLKVVEVEIINRLRQFGGVDALVLLGDIFDRHKTVDIVSFTAFSNFLDKLLPYAKEKLVILVGNHDRVGTTFKYNEHFMTFPTESDKLVIVDHLKVIRCSKFKFTAMPFYHTQLDMLLDLDSAYTDVVTSSFVVAHQHFTGGGILTEMDWPLSLPPVVAGHAHDSSTRRNLHYIGTPYQVSFGESLDKYLAFLRVPDPIVVKMEGIGSHFIDVDSNTRKDNLELVMIPMPDNIPKKYTYMLDITQEPKKEELKDIITHAKKEDEHHIKIRYRSSQRAELDEYTVPKARNIKVERIMINDVLAKTSIEACENKNFNEILEQMLTGSELAAYKSL